MKSPETYEPDSEEIKRAEDMMTPEQKSMSEEREVEFEINKFEQKKEEFESRFEDILARRVTPETFNSFFDNALNDLVRLTEDIVSEYREDLKREQQDRVTREMEDEAIHYYGLPELQNVLEVIGEKQELLRNLIVEITQTDSVDVFVPPGGHEVHRTGQGGDREKDILPRMETLLYILTHDLSMRVVPDENGERDVQITSSTVTPQMMRNLPYYRVLIESLSRVVYVCNEEENATYIFDTDVLQELGISIDSMDFSHKVSYPASSRQNNHLFRELIERHPNIGKYIIQCPSWREKIITALTQLFQENRQNEEMPEPKSDFVRTEQLPMSPEGWKSTSDLIKELNADFVTIKKILKELKEEDPEKFSGHFDIFRSEKGPNVEKYSPFMIEEIEKRLGQLSPEGWKSTRDLIRELRISWETIKKILKELKEEDPEKFSGHFDLFRIEKGPNVEKYSPFMIEEIEKRLNKRRNRESK